MYDQLVPLSLCGCHTCLRQAAKNAIELWEELERVLDEVPAAELPSHTNQELLVVQDEVEFEAPAAAELHTTAEWLRSLAWRQRRHLQGHHDDSLADVLKHVG